MIEESMSERGRVMSFKWVSMFLLISQFFLSGCGTVGGYIQSDASTELSENQSLDPKMNDQGIVMVVNRIHQ